MRWSNSSFTGIFLSGLWSKIFVTFELSSSIKSLLEGSVYVSELYSLSDSSSLHVISYSILLVLMTLIIVFVFLLLNSFCCWLKHYWSPTSSFSYLFCSFCKSCFWILYYWIYSSAIVYLLVHSKFTTSLA